MLKKLNLVALAYIGVILSFVFWQVYGFVPRYYEPDAPTFYYQALILSNGGLPYISFVDNKNPGFLYFLSVIAKIFGWNYLPSILIFSLIHILNVFLINHLANMVFPNKKVHKVLQLLIIITIYGTHMLSNNSYYVMPEVLEICLMLGAFILYLKSKPLYYTGVILSLSFLVRQSALYYLFIVILHLLIERRRKGFGELLKDLFVLGTSFALPILLLAIIALTQGWLQQWVYYAFTSVSQYITSSNSLYDRLVYFLWKIWSEPATSFTLFNLGFGAYILVTSLKKVAKVNTLIIVSLIISPLMLLATPFLFLHHYLQILPFLVIGLIGLFEFYLRQKTYLKTGFLVLNLTLIITLFVYNHITTTYALTQMSDPSEKTQVANWLKQETNSNDQILVWGYDNLLYLLSQRRAAVRFHDNLLIGGYSQTLKTNTDQVSLFNQDLAKNPPKIIYIVKEDPVTGRKNLNLGEFYPNLDKRYKYEQTNYQNYLIRYYRLAN